MKILMTADAVGGVWTYAMELAAALAPHGVQFVLATMGPPPGSAQRAEAGGIPGLRLECTAYKLEWMSEPWQDVDRASAWLLELARREQVDLVHLNGYAHAVLPWRRPVLCVAHSCVCSWWHAVHGSAPPAEWDSYRARVCDGLAHASCIVAPTHAFLQEVRRWYAPQAPMRVIHNARSPGFCTRTEPHRRRPVIFACGRAWDEAKSVRALDTAVRDLPWRAYIAGNVRSPDGKYVRLSSLHCLGALPARELAAWLKRATIFVHPSKYEPFGLAVLEAALAGCALVLSDVPTLRELWEGAALFVKADDAAALNRALRALISDEERRRYLSSAANARAGQYRPERMAGEYLELYRELCASARGKERAVA